VTIVKEILLGQMGTRTTYARGEKCATVLLTEIQVGKDTPCRIVFYQRRIRKKNTSFEKRTFCHSGSFDGFVINCTSALLNELVTLGAEIDHFCALHAKLDELLRDLMNDVCGCLWDD